jgi:hypothetical protein
VVARVAKLYETGEGDGACPGEDKCQVFQSSAADQPPEARCPSCPKRADGRRSTVDGPREESWDEEQLLDRVDRLARERDSGRPAHELASPLEWELLMLRDDAIDSFKRAHEIRMAAGFELLLSMITAK